MSLTITDNSTNMISVKTNGNLISIRMHRMFLEAGDGVIREIAAFVRSKKGSTPLIRDFIRKNRKVAEDLERRCRRTALRTRGNYHDLEELFVLVNGQYFGGKIRAAISWGKRIPRKAVRKLTLGSYSQQTNTIWINPVLDRKNIPRYVVKFIVYHEMLHCRIPSVQKNGRRIVHSREFRERERLFEHYDRVMSWEKRQ